MFSWFGKVSFVPYSKVMAFAVHLKEGRMMGSRCKKCGYKTFPPVADCPQCLSPNFEFVEYNGKGKLFTFSTIAAAPTGFEDEVPYTIGVVELEEGGRLLAWIGETIPVADVQIGMDVQAVPRIFEETEDIKVYYTIETPGTPWGKSPPAHLG
jgi:uncharacterized OB-fold protein